MFFSPPVVHSDGTAAAQDPAAAATALDQASTRLREAAAFGRGDPQPIAALGDALAARADRCAPSGEDPLGFLRAALEQGYRAALRLHARDGDALVGVAEVGKPFSFFFLRVPLCPSVRACWCVRHSMVRLQRLRPLHGGTFRPTHARRQPRAQLVPVWDVHPPVPACVIRVFLNVLPRSFLTLTQ